MLDAATTPPQELLDWAVAAMSAPLAGRGRSIIENVLRTWTTPEISDVLRAIFLCASLDEPTREKLRSTMSAGFIHATADRLPHEDRLVRAGLVSSQVIGICWTRYLWQLEPMARRYLTVPWSIWWRRLCRSTSTVGSEDDGALEAVLGRVQLDWAGLRCN